MSIFKAYDIRGIYPEQLDEALAYNIGRAYVIKFKPKHVAVGRDMRQSGVTLHQALVKGITDQGCDVTDIGVVTTPMMYFAAWNYDFDGGLTVSASHNPKEYNGVKMVKKGAIPISGDTGIYEIRDMVQNIDVPLATEKGHVIKKDIFDDYLKQSLGYKTHDLRHFNIVIDTANAMGGPIASAFFNELDVELTHMYPELDGSFPNHEANPLKTELLKPLQDMVVEKKADFGISFDGDADRCAFVDEKGAIIPCDILTALIAEAILDERKGAKILYDVRSSKVVGEIVKENGGIPGRCNVGHSLVKTQMKKQGAVFAGELSGHYYLEDEHYAEAPFFVILKIMELITATGKPLSELIAPLKRYYQSGEINSKVEDKQGKMKELAQKYSDAKVDWMDGVTIEYNDWWCNVRPSNTEPYLRLNLEADTQELMEEKRDEVLTFIRST